MTDREANAPNNSLWCPECEQYWLIDQCRCLRVLVREFRLERYCPLGHLMPSTPAAGTLSSPATQTDAPAAGPITVLDVVRRTLVDLGMDGLVNPDGECGCGLDVLDPGDCLCSQCCPARRVDVPEGFSHEGYDPDWGDHFYTVPGDYARWLTAIQQWREEQCGS